jgi:hypothetical protein
VDGLGDRKQIAARDRRTFRRLGLCSGSPAHSPNQVHLQSNFCTAADHRNVKCLDLTPIFLRKSIFGQTATGGTAVFIDANSKLGTLTSSKRFKEDIKPVGKASEALFALKPVTFHYKKEIDPASKSQFGLVAKEVEKVNHDLVVRDT